MSLTLRERQALDNVARLNPQVRNVRLDAPAHRPIPARLYVWSVGVVVAIIVALMLP